MPNFVKLPQSFVNYFYGDEPRSWSDPTGKYLCGSCSMRIPPHGCAIVDTKIDLKRGGCIYYLRGPATTTAKMNPASLSPEEALYSNGGPFGCERCRHFSPGVEKGKEYPNGCMRVESGGRGIDPKGCCSAWEAPGYADKLVASIKNR